MNITITFVIFVFMTSIFDMETFCNFYSAAASLVLCKNETNFLSEFRLNWNKMSPRRRGKRKKPDNSPRSTRRTTTPRERQPATSSVPFNRPRLSLSAVRSTPEESENHVGFVVGDAADITVVEADMVVTAEVNK